MASQAEGSRESRDRKKVGEKRKVKKNGKEIIGKVCKHMTDVER